jgi:hypothetical protein
MYAQADRTQQTLGRRQREIGVGVVPEGIELHLLQQRQQVRELQAEHPVRPQDAGQPGGAIEQIRGVRQHVVRHDNISAAVAHRDVHRGLGIKAGIGGQAEHRNAGGLERVQQGSVRRADFDHQRAGIEAEPVPQHLDIAARAGGGGIRIEE